MSEAIEPARYSRRFARLFRRYTRRLLGKRFNGVRLARGSEETLRASAEHAGPIIVAMNHPSWWDPIVGVAVYDRFFDDRTPAAPIEMEMWRRFGFMRRLGLFGVDISHPDAQHAMVEHVRGLFTADPGTVLLITPQGRFVDVREPVGAQPGVGAIAARADGIRVVSLAIEVVFWHAQRPELLLRAEQCPTPTPPTTAGWTRAIRSAMQGNGEKLAALSIAREESAFAPLLARRGGQVNPLYDVWARLRGRSATVVPASGREGRGR